jgi:hypothetical protein
MLWSGIFEKEFDLCSRQDSTCVRTVRMSLFLAVSLEIDLWPAELPTPLFCQHGFSNLTSVSALLHVAEGCAVKAMTLRFCVYFNCSYPVMVAGRRIACSVPYWLGRSLSACEFCLCFNWDSLPQLPPFCLLYNYSYFQFICFILLSNLQYLFLFMFVRLPVISFVCNTISFWFICAVPNIWDLLPIELAKTVKAFDLKFEVGHDHFLAHLIQFT